MNYPKYVEIDDEKYEINTDFRVAIECNEIAEDYTIGDFERFLAIIYKLYGEKGLSAYKHHDKLMELAQKYLSCGKTIKNESNEEPDMDYIQDMDYIEASFMSDFRISLADEKMHWWKFNKLINGLSNSEMGNCCVLNRIRNLRSFDTREIKDKKERDKIEKIKKEIALKKKSKPINPEQIQEILKIQEKLGLRKE